MTAKKTFSPAGQLWLSSDGENVLNEARIALLEQIGATGSITRAGKAAGISYRTAWLTIDQMNNLSDQALVVRLKGGKSGGGTSLTPHGAGLVRVYRAIQAVHGAYMERLRDGIRDFDRFLHLTRKIALKTSARNQLFGKVESARNHGLDAVVALRLKGGDRIISRITLGGLESLGLGPGDEAYALIKANWISVGPAKAGKGVKAAAMNALDGKIESLTGTGAKAEVAIRLPGGSVLIAMIAANESTVKALRPGKRVSAGFSPSDVILGVAR